jgi:poly(3-hydroxybutyrate) depolymerase
VQTTFVPGYSSFTGLGPLGYVYIPSACNATTAAAGTPACRLHVAWHGCNQYAGTIGGTYVLFAGYLEWAAQNNLVVLFPQAATTLSNPEVRSRGPRPKP